MRAFPAYLSATTVFVVACGGSSGTKPPGDSGTTVCANLACLRTGADLLISCAVEGQCVEQRATTLSGDSTICFDNGARILATEDITTTSTGMTTSLIYKVKKNDALCYTQTFTNIQSYGDGGISFWADALLEDAAGNAVVAARFDVNDVATVTCPGMDPTLYSDGCGYPDAAVRSPYVVLGSSPPTCTDGTCSF